ncbi:MAG: C4-type zinc ribbon domain-containing protein [Nocardioides sp.]|nr:C4-type zinc ribbon domain-containing protein [Nocardioides sp.]
MELSRTELDNQRRDLQIEVDDLTVEQAKVDADVESVKARRVRDQDRMDKGLITNPKDLHHLQGEMESLQRRISSLEDDEIEVMEKLEEAQSILDAVVEQVAIADARIAELTASRDDKTGDIDIVRARRAAERGPAVEGMPEDLMKVYDRVRAKRGGVGAAELRQRRCTGCQLNIDNAELAVIKAAPEDTVVRCEECTRILVRTPESGL